MSLRRRSGAALSLASIAASIASAVVWAGPALASSGVPTSGREVVLAGLYSDRWDAGADIHGLGAAAGKGISLSGTFHVLRESEDGWEGTTDWLLEQAWSARTTPLANVNVTVPAAEVASGAHDAEIVQWSRRVLAWTDRGGGRSVLVAPMQEMNGEWVPYGMDPPAYRAAFRRFVELARSVGLDETRARWVFAPNAWSTWPYTIRDYYPGDDVVDVAGISVYNLGSQAGRWSSVGEAIGGGLAELRSVAPFKPYLLTQVGSSTAGGDRDAWLRDLFTVTAADPNVVGFVYFNFIKETDWKLWDGAGLAPGWRDGMQMPTTAYHWPLTEWFQPGPLDFAPYEGAFGDDDDLGFQPDIDWLANRNITQGCANGRFCPSEPVTRGQIASFMARALKLPPASIDHFADDAGSPYEPDINALVEAGITQGCGLESYCPGKLVTRQQLASLLARALGLRPTPTARFIDAAQLDHGDDIGALWEAGITDGCGDDRFCPWAAVPREQVAAFLHRSLDRPWPSEIAAPPPPPRRNWAGPRPL